MSGFSNKGHRAVSLWVGTLQNKMYFNKKSFKKHPNSFTPKIFPFSDWGLHNAFCLWGAFPLLPTTWQTWWLVSTFNPSDVTCSSQIGSIPQGLSRAKQKKNIFVQPPPTRWAPSRSWKNMGWHGAPINALVMGNWGYNPTYIGVLAPENMVYPLYQVVF